MSDFEELWYHVSVLSKGAGPRVAIFFSDRHPCYVK